MRILAKSSQAMVKEFGKEKNCVQPKWCEAGVVSKMGANLGLNGIKFKCSTDDVTKPPCSLLAEGEKLTVS